MAFKIFWGGNLNFMVTSESVSRDTYYIYTYNTHIQSLCKHTRTSYGTHIHTVCVYSNFTTTDSGMNDRQRYEWHCMGWKKKILHCIKPHAHDTTRTRRSIDILQGTRPFHGPRAGSTITTSILYTEYNIHTYIQYCTWLTVVVHNLDSIFAPAHGFLSQTLCMAVCARELGIFSVGIGDLQYSN